MDAPSSSPSPPPVVEPAWANYREEELLAMRICDLQLRIEGSELEPRVEQLHDELGARGIQLRPPCYLGDEWFTPSEQALIAIPFYLAHPRLKALELRQVLEVEGGTPEWCMQLLRHECGHAVDHAFRFSRRRKWKQLFGNTDNDETPDIYRPRPYSKSFVRHLGNWYAQAHPDEDWAETFAVWLGSTEREWRARYRKWKALEKIEYVHELMQEAAGTRPPYARTPARRISDATRMRKTLARYYIERRNKYAEDYADVYDTDLRAIFGGEPSDESAAHYLRKSRKTIVPAIVQWTGEHKYTVDRLLRRLMLRCEQLDLMTPKNTARVNMDLSAYVAALVTNHLHTGRFKRSV